jgi:hypothetical protein
MAIRKKKPRCLYLRARLAWVAMATTRIFIICNLRQFERRLLRASRRCGRAATLTYICVWVVGIGTLEIPLCISITNVLDGTLTQPVAVGS